MRIVISHSTADARWRDGLRSFLAPLDDGRTIVELWDRACIQAGHSAHTEAEAAFRRADLALVLVSANYLADNNLIQQELPRLFIEQKERELILIPIILSPCLWESVPELKTLTSLPRNKIPLSESVSKEAALHSVAVEIKECVHKWHLATADNQTKAIKKPRIQEMNSFVGNTTKSEKISDAAKAGMIWLNKCKKAIHQIHEVFMNKTTISEVDNIEFEFPEAKGKRVTKEERELSDDLKEEKKKIKLPLHSDPLLPVGMSSLSHSSIEHDTKRIHACSSYRSTHSPPWAPAHPTCEQRLVGKHRVAMEGDVISVEYHGALSVAELIAIQRIYEVRLLLYPRLFSVFLVTNAIPPSIEVRKKMAEWRRLHKLAGTVVIGASLPIRTIGALYLRASELLGLCSWPVRFFDSDAEALAFIDGLRTSNLPSTR